jgi:hypothetical protein
MNANSGQSRPTLEDAFDNPKLNFVLASIARRVRDHFVKMRDPRGRA